MATKLKVTYTNDKVVEVIASPRAQVETERHFKSTDNAQSQQIESSYYLAWASLHFAGKEAADFEQWLNTITDVEQVEKTVGDEKATDPTPAAATPTGSSD